MKTWKFSLGKHEGAFVQRLEELAQRDVVLRLWQKDHTLWDKSPREITNRLDWLEAPCRMRGMVRTLEGLVRSIQNEGFTRAVLLGMGGSSLAPLVFSRAFSKREEFLDLEVLDTTDPVEIQSCTVRNDPRTTLYVVSTKSGTTLETAVLFRYFFTLLRTLGIKDPGGHFVAITDPGSPLVQEAQLCRFRGILCNNPNIGGRYSLFSFFGLFPAALLGIDLVSLLEKARRGMEECFPDCPAIENPGVFLGAFLGSLALSGCDKIAFLFPSPDLATFGAWLEQLLAESTGKGGRGILPVVEHEWTVFQREDIGYILFFERESQPLTNFLETLQREEHPYVAIPVENPYVLGKIAYFFEFATALAGYFLHVNPFDQPDVESTKHFTRDMLRFPQGFLPEGLPRDGEIVFLSKEGITSLRKALEVFLQGLREDGYLAIQAFVSYDASLEEALLALSSTLRRKYGAVITLGYGPRYLHSTGQLHKGDGGKGSFLQIVTESEEDLLIPDRAGEPGGSLSFGTLKMAQALADRQALLEKGRNVLTVIFPSKEALHALSRIQEVLTGE